MIEVVTTYAGQIALDSATADTPEAARLAARTLVRDALDAERHRTRSKVTAAFFVGDELVGTLNGKELV